MEEEAGAETVEQVGALPRAVAEVEVGLPGSRLLPAVPVEPGPAAVSAGTRSCKTEAPSTTGTGSPMGDTAPQTYSKVFGVQALPPAQHLEPKTHSFMLTNQATCWI